MNVKENVFPRYAFELFLALASHFTTLNCICQQIKIKLILMNYIVLL